MWSYEKKLQYPVKIARPNAALAKVIITQFGGPHCKRRGIFPAKKGRPSPQPQASPSRYSL